MALQQLRRRMGSREEFHGMLREFLFSSQRMLVTLESAQREGRTPQVERMAHTLKSMAHLVGASALENTCREVELKARTAYVPSEAVAHLSRDLRQAQGVVERLLH